MPKAQEALVKIGTRFELSGHTVKVVEIHRDYIGVQRETGPVLKLDRDKVTAAVTAQPA